MRAPSAGVLKLLGKLERRQPAWVKRGLSASRRVFKNQCADRGFAIADERRVSERQFALSCPYSVAGSQGSTSKPRDSRSRGDLRQHAVRPIAVDPPIAPARTRRLVADSLRKSRRDLSGQRQHALEHRHADRQIAVEIEKRSEQIRGLHGDQLSNGQACRSLNTIKADRHAV